MRSAIQKDFDVKADAIHAESNLAQQTHVLTVSVPDLLEGGGRAMVAYVFGYKTQKLMQVGVTWSKATDGTMTPERLFSDANILQAHFLASGYIPDTIATNGVTKIGLLLFRGADAAGHTTVLLLQGTFKTGHDDRRVLTPSALNLIYVEDPRNPDIFKLPEGQF